jgi:hypothetical protein
MRKHFFSGVEKRPSKICWEAVPCRTVCETFVPWQAKESVAHANSVAESAMEVRRTDMVREHLCSWNGEAG